jgi:hypothetical protein
LVSTLFGTGVACVGGVLTDSLIAHHVPAPYTISMVLGQVTISAALIPLCVAARRTRNVGRAEVAAVDDSEEAGRRQNLLAAHER